MLLNETFRDALSENVVNSQSIGSGEDFGVNGISVKIDANSVNKEDVCK